MAGIVEVKDKPSAIEIRRAEQAGYLKGAVCVLIHQLGGNTHAVLRLEQGARQIIQSGSLIQEAKDFLLDTILGDELEITLHTSEEGEPPYSEVLFGRTSDLRGLQCYTLNREVLISPRQIFDAETSLPVYPASCNALNDLLNQDEGTAFNITKSLLEITTKLLERRPEGLTHQLIC